MAKTYRGSPLFHMRLPEGLYDWFRSYSKRTEKPMSTILKEYLEELQQKEALEAPVNRVRSGGSLLEAGVESLVTHRGTLEKVTQIATSSLDLEGLLDEMVTALPQLLGAQSCSVFLLDKTTGNYLLKASSGLPPEQINVADYKSGEGTTGWVAKHGQVIRLKDVTNPEERHAIASDLEWKGKHVEVDPPCGILITPLFGKEGKIIGIVRVVEKMIGNEFTSADQTLLNSATRILAQTVESVWSFAESDRRESEAGLLREAIRRLNSSVRAADVINDVLKITADTLNSECCMVFILDKKTNKLVLKFGYGCPEELINRAEYEIGEGFTGWIAKTGESIIRGADASTDERWKGKYHRQIFGSLGLERNKSFIGVPIVVQGDVVGVLKMINKIPTPYSRSRYFTRYDERTLITLGTLIAEALDRDNTVLLGTRYWEAVTHVSRAFRERKSRDQILGLILEETRKLAEYESGNICVLEERDKSGVRKQVLRTVKAIGKYYQVIPEFREIEDDILGDMVRLGKVQVVNDKDNHPKFHKLRQQYAGTPYSELLNQSGSVLYIPLLLGEEVHGMLCAGSNSKGAFNNATVRALLSLAAVATMIVYSDKLLRESQVLNDRRSELLSTLRTIDQKISEDRRPIEAVLSIIQNSVVQLTSCDAVGVRLRLEEDNNELSPVSWHIPGFNADEVGPMHIGEGIAGMAAKKGETVYEPDVNKHKVVIERRERFAGTPYGDFLNNCRSTVAVPLSVGGVIIGVLSAHKTTVDGFTDEDIDTIELVANRAIAIWTSIWQKTLLDSVGRTVEDLDLDEVLQIVLEESLKVTGATAGTYMIVEGNILKGGAWYGRLNPKIRRKMVEERLDVKEALAISLTNDAEKGITKHVVKTGEMYNCPNVKTDPVYADLFEDTGSELAVPLKHHGRILGALNHEHTDVDFFKAVDEILLKTFAQTAAPIIYNAQVFRELQQVQEELARRRLGTAVGRFADEFAHEIRNPLNNIQMICRIIEILAPSNNEVLESVGRIKSNVDRANNIAQDLLDFSRGLRSVVMEPVNLYGIIDDALQDALPSLEAKQIQIFRDSDWQTQITVIGSASHLKRAFRNLIDNATDAMESGGELHVRAEIVPSSGMVCVEFRDTGCGMSEAVQARMFDLFSTTKEKGTGLGLWIVQSVVRMHQGNIEVESEEGKCTSVRLYLPLDNL